MVEDKDPINGKKVVLGGWSVKRFSIGGNPGRRPFLLILIRSDINVMCLHVMYWGVGVSRDSLYVER